jgi:hypothetical protein
MLVCYPNAAPFADEFVEDGTLSSLFPSPLPSPLSLSLPSIVNVLFQEGSPSSNKQPTNGGPCILYLDSLNGTEKDTNKLRYEFLI